MCGVHPHIWDYKGNPGNYNGITGNYNGFLGNYYGTPGVVEILKTTCTEQHQ